MKKKRKSISLLRKVFLTLIVPFAVSLTIAHLFTSLSGFFKPDAFPVLAIFGLFFPLTFMAVLASLFVLALLRSKWFWIQLLIFLISIPTAQNFIAFPKEQVMIQDQQIGLTSFNLHGFKGFKDQMSQLQVKDSIIRFLATTDSDIICLQEFRTWSGNLEDDIRYIKAQTGHKHHVMESYWKKGGIRSDAFLILSRFPIKDQGVVTASTRRNIGVYADVKIANRKNIRVLNVHLVSFGLRKDEIDMFGEAANMEVDKIKIHGKNVISKLVESFRIRQEEYKSLQEQLRLSESETILAGDFNETPASYIYRSIRISGLNDAHKVSGRYFGITYAGNLPLLRIDYIFMSKNLHPFKTKVHDVLLSDHYPVTTHFSY